MISLINDGCSKRIVATLIAVFSLCHSCDAARYYVRKSGSDRNAGTNKNAAFATLTKATRVAKNGDRIYVGAGVYEEQSILRGGPATARSRTIILGDRRGRYTGDAGKVIIRSKRNRWSLRASGVANLIVSDITFEASPSHPTRSYGCLVTGGSGYVYFLRCNFYDCRYGILHRGNSRLIANNCELSGGSFGIRTYRSTSSSIISCKFGATRYGIYATDQNATQIVNCVFGRQHLAGGKQATTRAIYARRTALTVNRSQFDATYNSIHGADVNSASIGRCRFTDTKQWAAYCYGKSLQLTNCQIDRAQYGIMLGDKEGNEASVQRTTIKRSTIGIQAYHSDYRLKNVEVRDCKYGLYARTGNKSLKLDSQDTIRFVDNQNAVYCLHRTKDDGQLIVRNHDLRNNQTGLVARRTNVQLSGCRFAGPKSGAYLDYCISAKVRGCQFLGNRKKPNACLYGLFVRGSKISIKNCTAKDNRYGFYLDSQDGESFLLSKLTSRKNSRAALYLRDGKWNWKPSDQHNFGNSTYGVYCSKMNWTVEGVTTDGSCNFPLVDRQGTCSIINTTSQGKKDGFYAYRSQSVTMTGSQLSSCGRYGAYLYDCQSTTIDGCRFNSNANGCYIAQSKTGKTVAVSNSEFNSNRGNGLRLNRTTLDENVASNLTFNSNRYGLRLYNHATTLRTAMQLSFSGNRYAVTCNNGNLTLDQIEIKSNRVPVYIYNGSLSINNCILSGRDYGVLGYVKGSCQIRGSTIQDARYGLHLTALADMSQPIDVSNCDIKDSTTYGVYVRSYRKVNPKLNLADCRLTNCRYGLVNRGATVTADRIVASQCKTRAIHQSQGSTTVRRATIIGGSSWAVHARGGVFTISESNIKSRYGIALRSSQGSVINSVVQGQICGILLNNNKGAYRILQSTIAGSRNYGVWQEYGATTVRNSIIQADRYALWNRRKSVTLSHDHNLVFSQGKAYVHTNPGTGEISKNPVFANAAAGDYRLAAGSPAINSGVDLSSLIVSDIEGNARPSFRRFEMGAYEYTKPSGSLRVLKWKEAAN